MALIQIRPERKRKILSRLRSRIALALAALLLFSSACLPTTLTERPSGGKATSERIQRRTFPDKRNDCRNELGREDGNEKPTDQQEIHAVTPGQELPNGGEVRDPEPPAGGNGGMQGDEPSVGGGESGGEDDPGQEQPAAGGENGEGDDPGQTPPAGENGDGEETPDSLPEDVIPEEGNRQADRESARDWELMFVNMEFTGDWNQDFLNVVFSQLGYTASRANFIVKDGVRQSYTRYGAWFGFPYGAWCAMFVSFCMNYAGVPKEAMVQSASVNLMVEWLRERDRYRFDWDHYSPQPGDLVFFSSNRSRTPTHVGVVTGVMNNTLLTVEGNNGPTVAVFMYDIHDPTIVGYGIFPDQSEYSQTTMSEPESESETESPELLASVPRWATDGLTIMGKPSRETN